MSKETAAEAKLRRQKNKEFIKSLRIQKALDRGIPAQSRRSQLRKQKLTINDLYKTE